MNLDNLNDQEKLKLASCINPDKDQVSKYNLDPHLERNILAAMLMDRSFMSQAKTLVSPKYFANHPRELICEILFKYIDAYHVVPPKHVFKHELKEAAKSRNKSEEAFIAELETVYNNHEPQLEVREYLLDQIEEFSKVQALKLAYSKTVDIIFNNEI